MTTGAKQLLQMYRNKFDLNKNKNGHCICRRDSASQTLLYIETLGRMKCMLKWLIFSCFSLFSPICSCVLCSLTFIRYVLKLLTAINAHVFSINCRGCWNMLYKVTVLICWVTNKYCIVKIKQRKKTRFVFILTTDIVSNINRWQCKI